MGGGRSPLELRCIDPARRKGSRLGPPSPTHSPLGRMHLGGRCLLPMAATLLLVSAACAVIGLSGGLEGGTAAIGPSKLGRRASPGGGREGSLWAEELALRLAVQLGLSRPQAFYNGADRSARRVWLYSCVAAERGAAGLLQRWLRHYHTTAGIPLENIVLIVRYDVDRHTSGGLQAVQAVLEAHGVLPRLWIGRFSPEAALRHQLQALQAAAPGLEDWVVRAAAGDNFHAAPPSLSTATSAVLCRDSFSW